MTEVKNGGSSWSDDYVKDIRDTSEFNESSRTVETSTGTAEPKEQSYESTQDTDD